MSEDRWIALIGSLMVLVLLGAGLAHRRLGPRRWLKLSVVWVLIFLAAWAVAAIVMRFTHTDFT